MSKKKGIVVIGATSAIAEHCARLWLQEQPANLTLVGRDTRRVERVASDLRVRSPQSEIRSVQTDFVDSKSIDATVELIFQSCDVDIVLISHGWLPEQADCQGDLDACREALDVNGVSPVLFAEAFAKRMARIDRGIIALIGSVAGDRGRKSNYVYGAAKGLVARYAEGMQHRFAGTGVKVILIKPGPTNTPMTARMKGGGAKLASVESVAKQIVHGVGVGKPTIYVPGRWWLIMMVIRHLPSFLFNKMDI